jgi:SSS family solute:Na+ symporter
MLIAGGLIIAYLSLNAVSDGRGAIAGFQRLLEVAPQKFDMILSESDPNHNLLPGLSVLLGGMWIMNLSYWGFNQYIIQRARGAKDIKEAQAGLAFAAFLKLLVPLLVVIPGIAAFVLRPELTPSDQAYPTMMALAPAGLKGLIFAALVAAIVSSLGSMMNSIATIFTMDLYKPMAPQTSETNLVWIGRGVAFAAMVTAVIIAKPLLGNADQVFQTLQEYTGFITPGVVALFALGMFWKRATALSAFCAAIGSAVFSFMFKFDWTSRLGLEWHLDQIPFMNRVGYVFLLCVAVMVIVSLAQGGKVHPKAVDHEQISFQTSKRYNIAAGIIAIILIGLYWYWW